jgi:hypothetical protein
LVRYSAPEAGAPRHKADVRQDRYMKQKRLAGFINHELLTALFVVNILYWIGYGVAKGLGLHGKQSLIPPAITVGCFLAYIIGLNLKELIGRRKKN